MQHCQFLSHRNVFIYFLYYVNDALFFKLDMSQEGRRVGPLEFAKSLELPVHILDMIDSENKLMGAWHNCSMHLQTSPTEHEVICSLLILKCRTLEEQVKATDSNRHLTV